MARLLLFARHGSTGDTYSQRYIGNTNVPLDAAGRHQAAALGALLKTRHPERCLTSPLRRAVETAQVAMGDLGIQIETDANLREIDFGYWEGKTLKEIERAYPQAVNEWATVAEDFVFPGGESVRNFADRVRRVADRMVADPADVVLAVTHGGVIRVAICHLLGFPCHNYVLFGVRPASLISIELYDGKGVLTEINNSCCLPE